MVKIMFVCLGNICRSPLAEGIFKCILSQRRLDGRFYIDSAGTSSYHCGSSPDPRSIEIANKYFINLNHIAQRLTSSHLLEFDYIIAMDEKNLADITMVKDNLEGKAKGEICMMRDFDPDKSGRDVPDPYFGEIDGFEYVY